MKNADASVVDDDTATTALTYNLCCREAANLKAKERTQNGDEKDLLCRHTISYV